MSSNIISFPTLQQTEAWETPLLFDHWETPEICAQWLPGIFSEYAAALAQTTETPEALSVMTILGILSTVLMQRVVISPKQNWFEPINIYTLIALPPANHKSFVLKSCMQPALDWEKDQERRLITEIKRQRSERKTQEKRLENLRIKAAKAKSELEYVQLMAQITQQELELPEIPIAPLLFINDVTPESLATTLHEQGGRLAIFSDEGGILETLSGLYSQGTANIDILLKGIDGGEVRVRRRDRSFSLNPYLTVLLAVQPAVVRQLTEKKAYLGNGALERFLYVLPHSKLGYRTHTTPPVPDAIQRAYYERIQTLLQMFFLPSDTLPMTSKIVLTLSAEAQSVWRAYQTEIEAQLRPEGKFENCVGWAGKMPGFALRLAGLLHIAEDHTAAPVISEIIMRNALALAHALGDHALAAFGLMGEDPASQDAQIIYRWIQNRQQPSFTQSDITYAWRHRQWGSLRIAKGLRVLQERHLISQPIKVPARKPKQIFYVHPALIGNHDK